MDHIQVFKTTQLHPPLQIPPLADQSMPADIYFAEYQFLFGMMDGAQQRQDTRDFGPARFQDYSTDGYLGLASVQDPNGGQGLPTWPEGPPEDVEEALTSFPGNQDIKGFCTR